MQMPVFLKLFAVRFHEFVLEASFPPIDPCHSASRLLQIKAAIIAFAQAK
jgi:hypothetical protein